MTEIPEQLSTIAPTIVLVTGPSGAGRSTAIDALEDAGFEVIDNLPLTLLPRLLSGEPLTHPLALGIDVRNRDFNTDRFIDTIDQLTRTYGDSCQVMFVEADPDVLIQRYSETRRRHPLAPAGPPLAGIMQEMDLLVPIRVRADILIDTSAMTPHELRAEVVRNFAKGGGHLGISLQSFSYKRGLPRGLDVVFDCRFLRNPHWEPSLRALDGRNRDVDAYVAGDPRHAEFLERVMALLTLILPAHKEEGKSHVAIGFGCTGGQHRSVAIAERVASSLAQEGWQVSKRHRELERRALSEPSAQEGHQA